MELLEQHVAKIDKPVEPSWRPEVLGTAGEALPPDFDLGEVWQWFHARLRALGDLTHDDARLAALLNWNERMIGDALHAARLHKGEWEGEGYALQAQLEFTTAEFLAKRVLNEEPIPAPELRSA